MTNKKIANAFQQLAKIMELHGENKFKIRSYSNAYLTLRKLSTPLSEMSAAEISGIKGVGKAIAAKIDELLQTGQLRTYQRYAEVTPPGVQEMLTIKGFGPKKVATIWKEMEIETIGELLYACVENRLIEAKGFGQKTQEDLRKKLEYYLKSKDAFHYASLEEELQEIEAFLQEELTDIPVAIAGEMRRKLPIIRKPAILVGTDRLPESILESDFFEKKIATPTGWQITTHQGTPLEIIFGKKGFFGKKLLQSSSHPDFWAAFEKKYAPLPDSSDEATIFNKIQLPYIVPELRESEDILALAQSDNLPDLVQLFDIKGVVHAHTTYSDGINTLQEMAIACKAAGYQYLAITDHSKSAFYANGLKPNRVHQQWAEIDQLNQEFGNSFHIFKGIESDILSDGSLDYEEELLSGFDFIIASIHSNLRMDKNKATQRLITAIENPYTTILGHPTGRLLLSREGYPIDHLKVIDACAANNVAIELNANPYRLDLDWSWMPSALEKGVKIAINPDAHSTAGIGDIHYGVLAARKGRLTKEMCLNCLDKEDFGRAIAS